ncbi:MAG: TIGR02391 family protein [Actinomycetota bacterium]|nr:TIGR02391 family protein [Actinomycetota bacterium]
MTLQRQEEVTSNLGEDAPQLNAAHLHPWIWYGARSLWQTRHYREAVHAASVKLNAETQNKLDRSDISETDLFNQAFSIDPPQPGSPRLRVIPDDGSKTFKSVHRGVRAFAEGCYAAIRNPISHVQGELTEDQALEQLAAFSVLARWVDDASQETNQDPAGDGHGGDGTAEPR